jgi:hypothetical protein
VLSTTLAARRFEFAGPDTEGSHDGLEVDVDSAADLYSAATWSSDSCRGSRDAGVSCGQPPSSRRHRGIGDGAVEPLAAAKRRSLTSVPVSIYSCSAGASWSCQPRTRIGQPRTRISRRFGNTRSARIGAESTGDRIQNKEPTGRFNHKILKL